MSNNQGHSRLAVRISPPADSAYPSYRSRWPPFRNDLTLLRPRPSVPFRKGPLRAAMRSELTVCSTILSMAFLMSLLAGYANSRSVPEEVKIDDYGWTPLRIYDDADSESIIDVGCNARLPSEGVDHTFRLNLNTKDGIRSCIIELPPSVSIQFLSLNFHERHTFARIITGNVHNRPSVSSPLLRKNTPSDQIFSVDCAYGFLVVRFESPEDTVVFKVHHKEFDPENDMYVTDDQCRPRED